MKDPQFLAIIAALSAGIKTAIPQDWKAILILTKPMPPAEAQETDCALVAIDMNPKEAFAALAQCAERVLANASEKHTGGAQQAPERN